MYETREKGRFNTGMAKGIDLMYEAALRTLKEHNNECNRKSNYDLIISPLDTARL